MKNAIAIRHVAFEDAGILTGLLEQRGIALRYLEAGVDDLSPAKKADLLLVLEKWLIGHTMELTSSKADLGKIRAETARYARAANDAGKRLFEDWLDNLA